MRLHLRLHVLPEISQKADDLGRYTHFLQRPPPAVAYVLSTYNAVICESMTAALSSHQWACPNLQISRSACTCGMCSPCAEQGLEQVDCYLQATRGSPAIFVRPFKVFSIIRLFYLHICNVYDEPFNASVPDGRVAGAAWSSQVSEASSRTAMQS